MDVGAVGSREGSGATTAERSSFRLERVTRGTTRRFAQVDKITLLAMGLRMRAVCTELRAQPRFAPKYWGVAWDKRKRRWRASFVDETGRRRVVGFFARSAEAALAVNAAICRAGLTQRRPTNPVVAGRPVPRPYPTAGD